MGTEYKCCGSREEWLRERAGMNGIGGSEAAAICGLSKWCTPTRLWEEKTGRRKSRDLSGIEYVELGNRVEGPLRDLFVALHPELRVEHRPYDMLYQTERPWLFATLDGELTELDSGEKGVLEIKKFKIQSKEDWAAWDRRVPDYYYAQILHQFLASGFSFAYLFALLIGRENMSLRPYFYRREDCGEDMTWLLEEETKFMEQVRTEKMPGVLLKL